MKQMSYRQGLDLSELDDFERFQEAVVTEELRHHRQRTHMRKSQLFSDRSRSRH